MAIPGTFRCGDALAVLVEDGQKVRAVRRIEGKSRVTEYDRTNRGLAHFRGEPTLAPFLTIDRLKGKSFLDLGTGDGQLVVDLSLEKKKQGDSSTVIGVDLVLKSWQRDQKDNFVEADLTRLPFNDKSFDVIFSWQSVFAYDHLDLIGDGATAKFVPQENLVVWIQGLNEIYRVSKPGATIILNTGSDCFREQTYRSLIEALGFEVKAVVDHGTFILTIK